jgi:hypothetical protein
MEQLAVATATSASSTVGAWSGRMEQWLKLQDTDTAHEPLLAENESLIPVHGFGLVKPKKGKRVLATHNKK